jgi:hypothetical protein
VVSSFVAVQLIGQPIKLTWPVKLALNRWPGTMTRSKTFAKSDRAKIIAASI